MLILRISFGIFCSDDHMRLDFGGFAGEACSLVAVGAQFENIARFATVDRPCRPAGAKEATCSDEVSRRALSLIEPLRSMPPFR